MNFPVQARETDRRLQQLLGWVAALMLLGRIVQFSAGPLLPHIADRWSLDIATMHTVRSLLKLGIPLLVNVVIGLFLARLAHAQGRNPWVWLCLGALYGVIGVVLFVGFLLLWHFASGNKGEGPERSRGGGSQGRVD